MQRLAMQQLMPLRAFSSVKWHSYPTIHWVPSQNTTYAEVDDSDAAEIDILGGMWEDLEEDGAAEPVYECIKTMKRRDLKMKKHRRKKRKKVML